jgi:hypothetical protein
MSASLAEAQEGPPSRPQPQPTTPLPVIPDWDPDSPPPDGYVMRSGPHAGLLAGGATLSSIGWVTSAVFGGILAQVEEDRGLDGDGVEAEDWFPMFIPVVGPFITIQSVDADPLGAVPLLIDGIVQLGGFAMLLSGSLVSKHRLVPQYQQAEVEIGPGRVSLKGAF